MSRIKLYTKNFVILFISMQLVNLMIVYFKTKQFVFEITSVQAFIIIYIIGLFYNVILIYRKNKDAWYRFKRINGIIGIVYSAF